MKAVARIERTGVPINTATLQSLLGKWEAVKERLISDIDRDFGVFEGTTFKHDRFGAYLAAAGIKWPATETGRLSTDDDTFREMTRRYPQIASLRELRVALAQMRHPKLAVGPDGRNRCLLSPFGSITSRNQPSNSEFIFGPSAWMRGLIQPAMGQAVAYVDWEQQEFGIAAALSGDKAMLEAYTTGDPYLTFAKQAGAAPPEATKQTHGPVRDLYKQVALALQYGMGRKTLAFRLGKSEAEAKALIAAHKRTYCHFWQWSDAVLDFAKINSFIYSAMGWRMWLTKDTGEPTLRNFPMQANGAEMLRLACCFATEAGISVCAPVHDALLIEAPEGEIEGAVGTTQEAMAKAGRIVLAGFGLRTDVKIIRHPDRYMDVRGEVMWETVMKLIGEDA
jgi:DNA polymerase I-like protein with 3'-5' exonuclease and polymerase domains